MLRLRGAMKRHEVLTAGSLAGLLGGVAMMAVAMIGAVAADLSPSYPLAIIGDTLLDSEAGDAVAARAAFGALLHLTASAGIGVVLAAIVAPDFPTGCAVGLCIGLAMFVMAFMMSVVVPWASPGFRAAAHVMGGTWVVAHVAYGAAVGVAPSLRRWTSRETSERASQRPAIAPPATPAVPTHRA